MIVEIFKAALLAALPVGLFTYAIVRWSITSGRMDDFGGDSSPHKQFKAHVKAQKKAKKAEQKARKAEKKAEKAIRKTEKRSQKGASAPHTQPALSEACTPNDPVQKDASQTEPNTPSDRANDPDQNSQNKPKLKDRLKLKPHLGLSRRMGGDFLHNKIMSFGGGFYGTMSLITYAVIESVEIWQFLGKIFGPDKWFANIGLSMLIDFIVNSVINFVRAIVWFATLPDYLPVEDGWIWLVAAYAGYFVGLRMISNHRSGGAGKP